MIRLPTEEKGLDFTVRLADDLPRQLVGDAKRDPADPDQPAGQRGQVHHDRRGSPDSFGSSLHRPGPDRNARLSLDDHQPVELADDGLFVR